MRLHSEKIQLLSALITSSLTLALSIQLVWKNNDVIAGSFIEKSLFEGNQNFLSI